MVYKGIEVEAEYLTVEDAATLTGRSVQMVRRYVRRGDIDSIQDPDDHRRHLISTDELKKIAMLPAHGRRLKRVPLTMSDGTVVYRVVPVLTK